MEFTIYLLLHRAAFGGFLLFALSLFYQLFHISIFYLIDAWLHVAG